MTTMTAVQIRKAIGDVGFPYSIRKWRDGEIWVSPNYGTEERCALLCEKLNQIGFETIREGKSGTAGYWIINATVKTA
ncbi:hypothetical protein EVB53_121 [Rhizobium phage RHph_Y60]|nr:hypothetical protein EVB53_121 [Rhizobium phage RHph_Y60]